MLNKNIRRNVHILRYQKRITKNIQTLGHELHTNNNNGFYSYVSPTVEDLHMLNKLFSEAPFDINRMESLHCTLMYSPKNNIPREECNLACKPKQVITCRAKELALWEDHKGRFIVVILLSVHKLKKLHDKWKKIGGVSTYPDYIPHTTIIDGFLNKTQMGPTRRYIKAFNKELNDKPLSISYTGENFEPIS